MSLTFVKQVYNGTIFSSYHFSDPYLRVISRQILVLVPQNQSKYFNTALNILPLKTNIKEILQKVCIVWIIRVNYVGTDFVQILIVSFIWDRFRHRFEFIFQFPEYFKCLGFYLRQNNLTTHTVFLPDWTLKNGASLILPSSIAWNSSAPNAKIIFEILWGILERRTNSALPSRPCLKNSQNGTF